MNLEYFNQLTYETRNLGVPAFALRDDFFADPDESALRDSIIELQKNYECFFAQAKVEKEHFSIIPVLGRCGFMYIETAIIPFTHISKNRVLQSFLDDRRAFLPKKYYSKEISLLTPNSVDSNLAEEVRKIASESFVDDRFHLDPFCTNEQADRRYVNWVDDLQKSSATFHVLMLQEELAGFMIRRQEHLVLAGFTRKYAASGLGDFLWLSVLAAMLDEGLTSATTQIAVNNTNVLNLYTRLAFKFRSPATIFHLWHLDNL